MSMKVVLVAAASVMAVSPAFAMSNSAIVNHTGGPIPYSQLVSMDKSGYSARAHHKSKKTAAADQSVAANTTATPTDQTPAPAAPAAPTTSATPDAVQSSVAPPASAPSSPGAAPPSVQ